MKVFLVWSGVTSKRVADFLHGWLQSVIQDLKPWAAQTDIEKGRLWRTVLADGLETSAAGIICVTPTNITAPWLNFEIGALSTAVPEARVAPLLIGVTKAQLGQPLSDFQLTTFEKDDILKLSTMLNAGCEEQLSEHRLTTAFEKWWPEFSEKMQAFEEDARAESIGSKVPTRGPEEIQAEILDAVRELLKRTASRGARSATPLTAVQAEEIAETRAAKAKERAKRYLRNGRTGLRALQKQRRPRRYTDHASPWYP